MNILKKSKMIKRSDCFIIIIALFSLLPILNKWYVIRAIPLVVYIIYKIVVGRYKYIRKDILILFVMWGGSLLMGQFVYVGNPTAINDSAFVKEIMRWGLFLLLALSLQDEEISVNTIVKSMQIIIIFHFSIQLLQFMKVEQVFDIIREYYMDEYSSYRHLSLAYNDGIESFRSGSIYINPNVYLPLALLSVVTFMQAIENSKNRKSYIVNGCFLCISIISVFFCGSRTGFVSLVVLIALYILGTTKMSVNKKILTMVLLIICGTYLITNADARIFKVVEGVDNSYSHKLNGIIEYIKGVNPIAFILGSNIGIGSAGIWGYDFEVGYIFAYFGMVGIIFYLILYKFLIDKLKFSINNGNAVTILCKGVIAIFFLVSLTASVFMNVPMFYFFSIIFFTKKIS